jgi:hypothetical protein
MPLQSNAFYTTKDVMSAYEHHQAELAQLARSKSSPSKSALQPLDANKLSKTPSGDMNRDIKPFANSRNPWEGFGKGKAPVRSSFEQPALDVDTEDDDDVIELQDDNIPLGMKKNKSTPRIYTIDDDDEDEDEVEMNIKPRIVSSQPSSSWRASQHRIKAEREQRGHRGSSQSLHGSASATRSPMPSPAVKSESTSRVQESQDWVSSSCQSHTQADTCSPTKNDYNRSIVTTRWRQIEQLVTMLSIQPTWVPPSDQLMGIVPSLKALVRSFQQKAPSVPKIAPEVKVSREYNIAPAYR